MGFLVLTANPPFMRDYNEERQGIEGVGGTLEIIQVRDEDEFARLAAEADALLTGKARISRKVIDNLQRCKVISASGIGLDAIDVEAATEKNIVVVNIPDIFTEEVADQAFALLLAVNRQVVFCHQMVVAGRWNEVRPLLSIPKIPGKTLGLVAFGNIARAVARRAKGFNLEILAYDPYVTAEAMREQGVEKVELDELFRRSDFISSHLPHTSETFHHLGERQFSLMKPSAIFVNTGRGRVVDEPALIAALQAGQLAGAGLDVFEEEPIESDNPLLGMPNVVLTPHMASASNESDIARRYRAGEEIAAVLSGRQPRNCVNGEVLARLNLRA
jgi:D-3-phosphoglycerate dehydrogenase